MIKLRTNQLGFSALEIAIFVIVLGLIGGSGYVVYNKTQNAQPAETTTETTPAANTVQAGSTQATANWTELVSGQGGFAMRLPDGWRATNFLEEDNARSDNITYVPRTKATIEQVKGSYGGDGTVRFSIIQFKNSENVAYLDGTETATPFSTDSLTGVRYYKKYPVEAQDGIGPYPGSENYIYEFKTGKTKTYVSYFIYNYNKFTKDMLGNNFTQSDPDQHDILEQALQTLRIRE